MERARILVIDDEADQLAILSRALATALPVEIEATTDPGKALDLFEAFRPDLVLVDLMMPHPDGLAVARAIGSRIAADDYLPVMMVTASQDLEKCRQAFTEGVVDLIRKPYDSIEVTLRVRHQLHIRALHRQLQEHSARLEQQVRVRTDQLVQSARLATVHALLGSVAHDLNNPLAIIAMQAEMLRRETAGGPLAARVAKVEAAAERCTRVMRNFVALAREQPARRVRMSLNTAVREALELVSHDLRSVRVELQVDLVPDLPALDGDPEQLRRLVLHLAANARQALAAAPAPRRLHVATRLGPGGQTVLLTVSDSGPGIPEAARADLFEPFYTTRPGEGLGLGLSYCRKVAAEHGGRIDLARGPGTGAVLEVELPVAPAMVVETPPPAVAAAGSRAVLVVDDEADVAEAACETLALAGYRTASAGNASEALARLDEASYDVVLTDVRMPGMDGPELFREIGRRHPRLRNHILFMSGEPVRDELEEFLRASGSPFLAKPFALTELVAAVGRTLADDSARS